MLSLLSAEAVEHPALTGIGVGILPFLRGAGSACVAANPLVQIAGIVIVPGSIVYDLSQFRSWPINSPWQIDAGYPRYTNPRSVDRNRTPFRPLSQRGDLFRHQHR